MGVVTGSYPAHVSNLRVSFRVQFLDDILRIPESDSDVPIQDQPPLFRCRGWESVLSMKEALSSEHNA